MKIKRKIYWNLCLVALLTMVVSALITTLLLCQDLQTQMRQAVMTEVRYLESAMEVSGKDYLVHLKSRGDGNSVNRITWVDENGSVLYDSYADSESLENHKDRPEIAAALKNGRGESVRTSRTLAEQTYYYAARLTDGSVIRVASTTKSALATVFHTVPIMIAMAILIVLGVLILAEFQTKRIIAPINQMNPDDPQAGDVYDELAPLVRRLEKQKETIRQQMEILKEKQEEFSAITENMREGFLVVDSKGDVMSYNKSALKLLGIPEGEEGMLSRHGNAAWEEHTDPGKEGTLSQDLPANSQNTGTHNDAERHKANVNIISINRSENFRRVVDEALKGGHCEEMLDVGNRHYQIIANPVAESEERSGAVVVILDVTEQQGREELRREFTANVSHELKTPLTSISGYAEIMMNGMVQPADMGRFSGKIYKEAQRLITLVGDIIRLSQLDEEKVQMEKSPVDLHLLASDVVKRLQDVAKKNQVTLMLTGKPTVVNGNPQILDEMIYNLCDNAIKYNKPFGEVEVNVAMIKDHPVLTVEDDGIGIPPEDQERIFERFYRVDKSHSRQIGGTGLGLSIVKHGAIYHKAKVELKSALGEGTTVRITF
ncbi:PAS domain-containing protein [Clostridium sp. OM02-18AC]|uniref:ATP-binding protein n=1 Tax=Clostridium sp. OM02-18AC TaxID=2292311 RepID=UPI000E4F75F1|nr:ATP-binding protein [Clostridium sp. OM02-18AC]RHV67500.1 PAS domain-containing protein [Clostridium sp. OM02-18AC]